MELPHSWKSGIGLRTYRRREPDGTGLYRIVYHNRQELEWCWEDRFQCDYGYLRKDALDSFDKYLNCGILVHGAARVRCLDCNHSVLVAFSCKQRGVCPSCGAKRAIVFAETLHERVLAPVPQRHVVFSIPKRLRVYFRYDRSRHKVLFRAAWQSLRDLYEAAVPGGTPAAVLTVQTSGDALNHNPHIHGISAAGVFLPDGAFQELALSTERLTELFTHRVLSSLRAAGLIDESVVSQLLCQRHSGFSAWIGERIMPEDAPARLFLSRYIDRAPVANDRIEIVDDIITYHHQSEHLPTAAFDPLEFLAALSVHIPDKWEQTVRYYGWYSARTRGVRRRREEQTTLLPLQEPEERRRVSKTWASLIKKIYELDPLRCPKCGGEMRVVAFIQEPREISRIMKNLGLPDYRAPPKIEKPKLSERQYVKDLFPE